jgi:hypothetical protein
MGCAYSSGTFQNTAALLFLMHYWWRSNGPAILYYSFPGNAILVRGCGLSCEISHKSGNTCFLKQFDSAGTKCRMEWDQRHRILYFVLRGDVKSDFRERSFENFKGMYDYIVDVDRSMLHTRCTARFFHPGRGGGADSKAVYNLFDLLKLCYKNHVVSIA